MAGDCKPKEAGEEAKYKLLAWQSHYYYDSRYEIREIADGGKYLFDNNIDDNFMGFRINDDFVEVELLNKCNLWAYMINNPPFNTDGKLLILRKQDNEYIDVTKNYSCVSCKKNEWVKIILELDKGTYKFKLNSSELHFSEWYFEKCIDLFCLLQYENNLYTFENNSVKEIQNSITKDNFINNGFKDYKLLSRDLLLDKFKDLDKVKLLTWADDINKTELNLNNNIIPFKPLDKLKQVDNGKFQVLMKEIK